MGWATPALMLIGPTLLFCLTSGVSAADEPMEHPNVVRPFITETEDALSRSLTLAVRVDAIAELNGGSEIKILELPLEADQTVRLRMERFSVTRADTRFAVGGIAGRSTSAAPNVLLYRGQVEGEPNSHAYLSFTSSGLVNGYVSFAGGERFFVSTAAPQIGLDKTSGIASGSAHTVRIHRDAPSPGASDAVPSCGVTAAHDRRIPVSNGSTSGASIGGRGPRVLFVAVDSDFAFYQLFNDETAAQAYIVQVIGAVSDIYLRDFDVRLVLTFSRVWPAGGEPINAADLAGFANHWDVNEDPTPYHLIHLFSGRRNLSYGGIAYVSGSCSGSAYGISGYLLGSFPTPVAAPHLGNWDVVVVAHEMGHNMATFHTHDGYSPPIDQCGSTGAWARSEIMSYCHTTPGGLLNIEMRFSKRVQDVVRGDLEANNCQYFDCNDNGVDDLFDIGSATSTDTNANQIPDECEDCNNNGILDTVDISQGAPDVNGNGVPDACEPDCNGNGRPDAFDISNFGFADVNGNLLPDVCETDCDGNEFADFADIRNEAGANDLDRDGSLDSCQDCNANGATDWIDRLRPGNIFIADLSDYVREYHAASGVAVATRGSGAIVDPYDAVFGPDRMLYVASRGNHNIVRVDPETGASTDFVAGGGGGLDRPGALTFGPNGNLYAASTTTNNVMEYDGSTGSFVRIMVTAGNGGLSTPHGIAFGPGGNLFVAGGNRVNEYDGASGVFLRNFVAPGAGGLSDARGIAFVSDGRLLVANRASNAILAYDAGGAPLGQFNNDGYNLGQPWGVRIGPNGNVFVARTASDSRLIEFDVTTGRYLRSFIRGDSQLIQPTGFAFRPESPTDCDANGVLDACELEPQSPLDCNANGIVDTCEVSAGLSADCNANSIPDACDIASGAELDVNGDGVPDSCAPACVVAAAVSVEVGGISKNRYLSFDPSAIGTEQAAIRVRLADLPTPFEAFEGTFRWVGPPQELPDTVLGQNGPKFKGSRLQCDPFYMDWSAVNLLSVFDEAVVPGATYQFQAIHTQCDTAVSESYSPTISVQTIARWGDIAPPFNPPSSSVQPDFLDIAANLGKFRNQEGSFSMARCDINPALPDQRIGFSDISILVDAFKGLPYPFPGPLPCP